MKPWTSNDCDAGSLARRRAVGALLAAAVAWIAGSGMSPAPAAAQAPSGYTMTAFSPHQHSFRFVNHWTLGDLTLALPPVAAVNLRDTAFGLCGGMSFAALDSFHARRTVPIGQTTEPAVGSALRTYVWQRQIQSLTIGNGVTLARFLGWQQRALADTRILGVRVRKGLRTLTREQFVNQIRPRLRKGEPVSLGMVNQSGLAAPWGNHQVLAIGFRNRPNGHASIAVYDPNHPISAANPNGITFLHTGNRRQTLDPAPTSRRARTGLFRGLFRAPYNRVTPPAPPWHS